MNILITGVTSFLGKNIAKVLLKEHNVYGLVRAESLHKLEDESLSRLNILAYDISDIAALNKSMPKINIDVCIHLAWAGVGRAGRMDASIQKANIENTLSLIRICKELGVKRFLFAGSQAEYGLTLEKIDNKEYKEDIIVDEKFPANPLSEYGKAKLKILNSAYELCKEIDIGYIHMRIFSVYGYGDHETSLIISCLKHFKLLENNQIDEDLILSSCRQLWNYLFIDDCARAIGDLATKNLSIDNKDDCIVNIAGTDTRSLREFALEIAQEFKQEDRVKFIEKEAVDEGVPYLNPCIDRLIKYIDFKPEYSFIEGIRKIEEMYSM